MGTTPSNGHEAIASVTAALAPLDEVSGAPPPFVVVDHESELLEALRPLAESGQALDELQTKARSWWARAKQHYAERFEMAVCPRG